LAADAPLLLWMVEFTLEILAKIAMSIVGQGACPRARWPRPPGPSCRSVLSSRLDVLCARTAWPSRGSAVSRCENEREIMYDFIPIDEARARWHDDGRCARRGQRFHDMEKLAQQATAAPAGPPPQQMIIPHIYQIYFQKETHRCQHRRIDPQRNRGDARRRQVFAREWRGGTLSAPANCRTEATTDDPPV
jgi:hypothetical protein